MWEEALTGIRKHLIIPTKHAKLSFVAELPQGIGGMLSPKMDHLVCFLPGAIALGVTGGLTEKDARKLSSWTAKKSEDMKLAKELMKTCWGMYKVTETGIGPEIAWFNAEEASLQPHSGPYPMRRSKDSLKEWKKDYIVKPLDANNLQRPETVESLLMMWRITGDRKYREWGWDMFQAFKTYERLSDGEGYTSLNNVNEVPPTRRDNMESFWLVSYALGTEFICGTQLTCERLRRSNTSTFCSHQVNTSRSPRWCSTLKHILCRKSTLTTFARVGIGSQGMYRQ
jgi:mannosyl-oligosaccharide alpha-1,2-mannosidase